MPLTSKKTYFEKLDESLAKYTSQVFYGKRQLTIRSTRPATAAIFNHTLLAKLVYNVTCRAHPQAGELKRYVLRIGLGNGILRKFFCLI